MTDQHEDQIPLREYLEALREADFRLYQERDRRYTDILTERQRAIAIKEKADRDALELARQIQSYKDLQVDRLRDTITLERGLYVKKDEIDSLIKEFERRFQQQFDSRDDLRREIENRFSQLLDPTTGIYARVGGSADHLRNWGIALLTSALLLVSATFMTYVLAH